MSIWKFKKLKHKLPAESQLTLAEGNTPIEKIFLNQKELAYFGIREPKTQIVYLKLETKNPNKSFKDRSLAYQVSFYLNTNAEKLLISSSGNAAIAAATYVSLTSMKLAIFVSTKGNKEKLQKLENLAAKHPNIAINYSKKPKSDAIKYARYGNYINLRGSRDDSAVEGFKTIAYEILEQRNNTDAIFIPCSSGTSTIGIFEGYKESGEGSPQLHICQTSKVHPIAKEFDVMLEESDESLADAIVDRVAYRKQDLIKAIKETGGSGWVINDNTLKKATEFLQEKTKIDDLTYNGCLSFAGYLKALKQKKRFTNPLCIISGI